MTLNDIDYQKLECIHVALQDLQNKYSIPEDDSDLDDAFKFVEDIRDRYLESIRDKLLDAFRFIKETENERMWLLR